ncbi:MAG TPA: hypothetical protein PLO33_19295 [Kouleothrix sp.]|uniref:hypothetical protein n=1 Tax=Kouleothrix sp. TaxID=2779161 RepID=UPI002CE4518B|nr:hypothetical protein [Kouleothrix sp.]HRC77838.1 hypothetical protein [Kouleothrix sp.]
MSKASATRGYTPERKGIPIEYKEYLKHDGYVTGIAYFSNPQGLGNFRIYVSGPPESVDRFAAEASVIAMQIAPGTDKDYEQLFEQQAEACRRQNERLRRQADAIRKLSDSAFMDAVDADERRDLIRAASDPRPQHDACKPNLRRDRLIEIEVLDSLKPRVPYFLSYTIDPSVARGTCDIWSLFDDNVIDTWANLTWTGGDPDLYLYRGFSEMARSVNGAGANESVYGWGGVGAWRLHVYGYSDASSYEISETYRWYQDWGGDDVPESHF